MSSSRFGKTMPVALAAVGHALAVLALGGAALGCSEPCSGSECAGEDASGTEDGGPRPDAGPREEDAGLDAGPPPEELCTPSSEGSIAADEDGDLAIDEGCEWHVGAAHWMTRAHVSGRSRVGSPRLSRDGLRLYFVSCGPAACAPFVVARASVLEPFGVASPVEGELDGMTVLALALSADELEAYFAVLTAVDDADLYRATRGTRGGPFGALVRVAELSRAGAQEGDPDLSADGLEIVFARDGELVRATRASMSAPFGAPEAIALPSVSDVRGGSLAEDRRSIVFAADGASGPGLYRAERADPSTAFEAPIAIEGIGAHDALIGVTMSLATRELFYVAAGAWSAGDRGVWRAQICRDGPCPELSPVPCAGGASSADGQHCYVAGGGASTWAAAVSGCAMDGAHLATVHSAAESAAVRAVVEGEDLWLGGYDDRGDGIRPPAPECRARDCSFTWLTREPWVYATWSDGEPNRDDEDCLQLYDTGELNDLPCGSERVSVCERERWPAW